MNAANMVTSMPWGDRTHLLPKAMLYAFSLDVNATSDGPYLKVTSSKQGGLRHLFGQSIITMPEGIRCDVPMGNVEAGDGEFGDTGDPSSPWLCIKIRTKLDPGATLYFDCTGVINFEGGPSAFRSNTRTELAGSAFLASSHEASTRTYRWLERRQLFGVGRVKGKRNSTSRCMDEWVLDFSFDLYSAA